MLTAACGSIKSQALAFVTGHSATIRRERGLAAERAFLRDILLPDAFVGAPRSMVDAMLC